MSWTNHLLLLPLIGITAGLPLGSGPWAKEAEQAAFAWVEMRLLPQHPDQVEIIGHVQGLSETEGRYTLSVARSGRAGTANTNQGGRFHVKAGEAKVVSRSVVNVPPGSGFAVLLTLYAGEKEIFSAELKSKS